MGERHWGQLTSATALVFHWDLRARVLARDIFLLGTATSGLLIVFVVVGNQAPQ